jgi:DNA-binding NarL/FixJ family response regulator
MHKIKIGIVEDHDITRKLLIKLLSLEKDFEISLEAENGVDLLSKIEEEIPDIIIMDIFMPKMNGIEASQKVLERYPLVKIIVNTQYDFEFSSIEMYAYGVKSYIKKTENIKELVVAIRSVYNYGVYVNEGSLKVIQRYLNSKSPKVLIQKLTQHDLLEHEIQILSFICKGLSSTDIGKIMYKSHRTVEKYREDLYRKLNVNSKKELIEVFHRILYNDIYNEHI